MTVSTLIVTEVHRRTVEKIRGLQMWSLSQNLYWTPQVDKRRHPVLRMQALQTNDVRQELFHPMDLNMTLLSTLQLHLSCIQALSVVEQCFCEHTEAMNLGQRMSFKF